MGRGMPAGFRIPLERYDDQVFSRDIRERTGENHSGLMAIMGRVFGQGECGHRGAQAAVRTIVSVRLRLPMLLFLRWPVRQECLMRWPMGQGQVLLD